MKSILILLKISLSICPSHCDIPKDNKHYMEGYTNEILMPDGDGELHRVNLVEDINTEIPHGHLNTYWIYSRYHKEPHQLVYRNKESVRPHYDPNKTTVVITHGWKSNRDSESCVIIRDAFLNRTNNNIIVLDWNIEANNGYTTAVSRISKVGKRLSRFLRWIICWFGGSWDRVHLIGFGLGAHVVGNAGRYFASPRRITGLDPAGPLWYHQEGALNSTDATYVEVIHTDGGFQGIDGDCGHADFYPNFGTRPQPGCPRVSACSHFRAYKYFAASVQYDGILLAKECPRLELAKLGYCFGRILPLGTAILKKSAIGLYGLYTKDKWPFDYLPKNKTMQCERKKHLNKYN